jgi:hypothetical protein
MKKPTPIPPVGVSINDTMLKRVLRWLLQVAVVTGFAVLIVIVLAEWMAGCGETYVDAKGVRHANDCIIVK